MLSAGEALSIAREVNRSDIELKEIESYIKNKAINGEYSVTLYPSMPYHPKTIIELKRFGYKVTSCLDEYKYHYCYNIKWGDKSEDEEEWNSLEW